MLRKEIPAFAGMTEVTMIDIFYPYAAGLDKFGEIIYSLRSLDMYAKFDYRIVIVGDMPRGIDPQKVTYIPHKQVVNVPENTLYDSTMKLRAYLDSAADGYFIRMYDDIYLLKEADELDLLPVKISFELTHEVFKNRKLYNKYCSSVYWKQLENTYLALKDQFIKTNRYSGNIINTESHCPEYFHAGDLLAVLNLFNAPANRLITSTLYHNYYRLNSDGSTPELTTKVKAGFYGPPDVARSREAIDKAVAGKKFLNHNDTGATPHLMAWIKRKYSTKSRFEL